VKNRSICHVIATILLTVGLMVALSVAAFASYTHLSHGPKISGAGWTLQVQDTGPMIGCVEFINTASTDAYLFSSQYSHSASPYYYYWTWKSVTTDPNWVTTASVNSNIITVKGTSPAFTVTRNMSWNGSKFTTTDQLSSKTAVPILVATNYDFVMENLTTANQSAICGVPFDYNNSYTDVVNECAPNPTIYMQQTNSSLGWLCDDDLLRNQIYILQTYDQSSSIYNQTIVQDYQFGLAANGTYTYNFAWYPGGAGTDYWSFINWVRRDWNMNYTCQGPVQGDQHLDMGGRNFNNIFLCPWFRFNDGAGIPDATYNNIQSSNIAMAMTTCNGGSAMGTTAPCFMCKIETNSMPVDWTTMTNGSTLVGGGYPTTANWYWLEPLTVAQTSTLNNNSTFAANWKYSTLAMDSNHTQQVVETDYICPGGSDWVSDTLDSNYTHWFDLVVYPGAGTTTWKSKGTNWKNYARTDLNYQGQYMASQIDYTLTNSLSTVPTSCTKGVFLDSFTLNGILRQSESSDPGFSWEDRWDYGQWDGNSVTNNVALIGSYFTDAAFVGVPARAWLLNYVTSYYGVTVFTNGHCIDSQCRSIPYLSKYQNFAETESDALPDFAHLQTLLSTGEPWPVASIAGSHLSTPISNGGYEGDWNGVSGYPNFGTNNWAAIQNKYVIMCLRNGSLFNPETNYVASSGAGSGGYGIINLQYPFTPVELHCGYLIGQEKILTAVSGTWYWSKSVHSAQPATCDVFDSCGNPIAYKTFTVSDTGTGTWKVVLALPNDWNNTCAIW
jgi:hypothetical protein